MNAAELLARLRDDLVVLEVTPEGRLRYDALMRPLADAEVALMREHRDDLVALLRAEEAERKRDDAVADVIESRKSGFSDLAIAKGWHMPGPLDWCVTCAGGTVWVDDAGRPRHPWCAARRRPA